MNFAFRPENFLSITVYHTAKNNHALSTGPINKSRRLAHSDRGILLNAASRVK